MEQLQPTIRGRLGWFDKFPETLHVCFIVTNSRRFSAKPNDNKSVMPSLYITRSTVHTRLHRSSSTRRACRLPCGTTQQGYDKFSRTWRVCFVVACLGEKRLQSLTAGWPFCNTWSNLRNKIAIDTSRGFTDSVLNVGQLGCRFSRILSILEDVARPFYCNQFFKAF